MWCKYKEEYTMKRAVTVGEVVDIFNPRPLETIKNINDFYVNVSQARGEDAANRLIYLLSNSLIKNQKILFVGHNGCGKSTELYKAASRLGKDYVVIQYSVGKYVDYLATTYIDIILSILNNITEKASEMDIRIDESILNSILNYWSEEKIIETTSESSIGVNADVKAKSGLLNIISFNIKTFFQSSNTVKNDAIIKVEHSIPQFMDLVNKFIDNFNSKLGKRKLLVIVDDLDKVAMDQANQIFIQHSKHITSLHTNIIYTFPISLYYSPEFRGIIYDFNDVVLLSMIKVKNKDGSEFDLGRQAIKEVIIKRADERLFEKDVLNFVIEKSGGCIRTAFRILREAALQAELKYFDDEIDDNNKIISMTDVLRSYRSYKSEMARVIRKEQIDVLVDIHKNKSPLIDEDNLTVMNLLMCLAVIEYNGDRWCDLNPAIEDFLIEKKLIENKKMDSNNDNDRELLHV